MYVQGFPVQYGVHETIYFSTAQFVDQITTKAEVEPRLRYGEVYKSALQTHKFSMMDHNSEVLLKKSSRSMMLNIKSLERNIKVSLI